ncbi:MAG: hypothetical protein WBV78_17200 [Roseobacter sp.]
MRIFLGAMICAVLSACTGGGQDAETYVAPQPAAETAPTTGINVSGYARVGVVKGG